MDDFRATLNRMRRDHDLGKDYAQISEGLTAFDIEPSEPGMDLRTSTEAVEREAQFREDNPAVSRPAEDAAAIYATAFAGVRVRSLPAIERHVTDVARPVSRGTEQRTQILRGGARGQQYRDTATAALARKADADLTQHARRPLPTDVHDAIAAAASERMADAPDHARPRDLPRTRYADAI